METLFKLKIPKLFQSSFNSCRTKPVSDVVDQSFFFHENRPLIDLFSPKPQPHSSSSSKPKTQSPKPKTSHQKTPFPEIKQPKTEHSVSLPLFQENKPKTAKKKKPHHRKPRKIQSFSSITDNLYYSYSNSDEDIEIDDQTTLFSSRSSDSSVSLYKNRAFSKKSKNSIRCRDRKATDVIPINGKCKLVKDSVAIVKKSNDPYEDFRVSMLEMIVDGQIFGGEELENLLKCFLGLNCEEHHRVICEVFTEIWETLFAD